MIVINNSEDISKISDNSIVPYINNLFSTIIKTYCPNSSLEQIGAIFILEDSEDLKEFDKMGISVPNSPYEFDNAEMIDKQHINCCLAINNDFAINIIGKKEFFNKWRD